MLKADSQYMKRALKLAEKGGRAVLPNPMVGAVIVKNGKVIGQGYHEKFGGPHAEVNAVASVKRKADLEGATMYVTLEPCRHFGKTPPCLDFVEAMGISKIICGSKDFFQSQLRVKSDELRVDFLEGEIGWQCRKLNKFFFAWAEKKRPYITVKIAVSADGFVAKENSSPVRLTTASQDKAVHQLRADHQAILVGSNTVLSDDPLLTVRHVKGLDPLRIMIDSRSRIPKSAKVFKDSNYLVWKSRGLKSLFRYLAKEGVTSVLVEPGPTLYKHLKKQSLIDDLIVYRSKKKLGTGLPIKL